MKKRQLYEVYFDKSENEITNNNYSCIIRSNKKPTKTQAFNCLKNSGFIVAGYHLKFISLYEYDDIDEKYIINL